MSYGSLLKSHISQCITVRDCCEALSDILNEFSKSSDEAIIGDKFLSSKSSNSNYAYCVALWVKDLREEPRDISEELLDVALERLTLFPEDPMSLLDKKMINLISLSKVRLHPDQDIPRYKERFSKVYPGESLTKSFIKYGLIERKKK